MNVILYNEIIDSVESVYLTTPQDLKNASHDVFLENQMVDLDRNFEYYNITPNSVLTIKEKKKEVVENIIEGVYSDSAGSSVFYLKAEINNKAFKILVDTGAQVNCLSKHMADLLNLQYDTRFTGVAEGVNTANIVGFVANAGVLLGNSYHIPLGFNVLDVDNKYFAILGVGFLTSTRCIIDLYERTLCINKQVTLNLLSDVETKLLDTPYDCTKEKLKNIYNQYTKDSPYSYKERMRTFLSKISTNIINNPNDEKYKNINIKNKIVNQMATENNNFMLLMQKIGFIKCGEHLCFKESISRLECLHSILIS